MNRERHASTARSVIAKAYLSQDRAVTGVVRFTVPSQKNPLNSREHWSERYKRSKLARQIVAYALLETKQRPNSSAKLSLAKCPVKKIVRFVRYTGGRCRVMDHEGFVASCKHYLDALKCGDGGECLIFDDSPTWVTLFYEQIADKERAGQLEVEVSG